jgi:hypothetical protein
LLVYRADVVSYEGVNDAIQNRTREKVVVVPVHHVILTRLRESKGMLCN